MKTFDVKGMHCKSCEILIKDILEEQAGVSAVIADHKRGIINVDFAPSVISIEKIKMLIKDEGYEVE